MAIRQRTSRSIAKRHDLDYFKRGSDVRRWQWRIAAIAMALTLLWLGVYASRKNAALFLQGPMSSSHAVFGQNCETCHQPSIRRAFAFRRHVTDSACLGCHVALPHHAQQVTFTPQCGGCHIEHRGSMRLSAVSDSTCTQCHSRLSVRTAPLDVASGIYSFTKGHPDFRPLRTASDLDKAAAFGLKFNHAAHLTKRLKTPAGLDVQLVCADCHRTAAELQTGKWRFARPPDSTPDVKLLAHAAYTPTGSLSLGMNQPEALLLRPADGRARMMPTSYGETCAGCHSLQFDEHIQAEAPHTTVPEVHRFVVEQISAYARAHPEIVQREIKSWLQTGMLPEQMPRPIPRTPEEWITARVARSETILYRGKCNLCHTVDNLSTSRSSGEDGLPEIRPSHQPLRFFSNAVFSHGAHQAVACQECHAKAITSERGRDLLLPSIVTCRRCHNGDSRPQGPPLALGHAESGCFLCHTYHGWDTPAARLPSAHRGFVLSELLARP
jgi:hypothetical protein